MKTKKKSGKTLRKSGKSQGKIGEFDGIKKVGTLKGESEVFGLNSNNVNVGMELVISGTVSRIK